MNAQQLNLFIVARGLLERGEKTADGTPPGAMAALVLTDLAVETAAKTTWSAHSPTSHPGKGYSGKQGVLAQPVRGPEELRFPRLLDDLLAAHRLQHNDDSIDLPHRRDVAWLHDLRNGVQHQANEPSEGDLGRASVYATDFVDSLLREFFGTSLAELSRASLVQNEEVRDAIKSAEGHAAANRLEEAPQSLSIAFELARYIFREGEPWRRRLRAQSYEIKRALEPLADSPSSGSSSMVKGKLERLLASIPASGSSRPMSSDIKAIAEGVFPSKKRDTRRLEELLKGLVEETQRLEERIEGMTVGGDPSEQAWFRRRVPRATAYGVEEGVEWFTLPPDPPLSRREYLRALDFVTTTALRWQEFPEPESSELDAATDEVEAEDETRLEPADEAAQ